MNYNKNLSLIIFLILIGFDIFLWLNIFFFNFNQNKIYFLNVGQGDSSLINLKKIFILIDAGPNSKINQSLAQAFKTKRNYIDLAIITHPQLDHFGGFTGLLDKYDFGAFIINGREGDDKSKNLYNELINKIKNKNIPIIILSAGDKIIYQDNLIEILSPDKNWIQSAELNDTGLVLKIKTFSFSSLFTADINSFLEDYLISKYDLKADILKVAHHGSKYSSNPIFRTDLNGNILIFKKDNKFIVQTEK
ncbi:MAG: hypothetical protein KatS3mg093_266 [Candidatus Parcubacteria bacterium]|nr:MAG: hypothetical protein KatS3mg093_266 [Candidatus Parcubacteria bacterium]